MAYYRLRDSDNVLLVEAEVIKCSLHVAFKHNWMFWKKNIVRFIRGMLALDSWIFDNFLDLSVI